MIYGSLVRYDIWQQLAHKVFCSFLHLLERFIYALARHHNFVECRLLDWDRSLLFRSIGVREEDGEGELLSEERHIPVLLAGEQVVSVGPGAAGEHKGEHEVAC